MPEVRLAEVEVHFAWLARKDRKEAVAHLLVRDPEHARKGCGGKAVLRIHSIALQDLNLVVAPAPERVPRPRCATGKNQIQKEEPGAFARAPFYSAFCKNKKLDNKNKEDQCGTFIEAPSASLTSPLSP